MLPATAQEPLYIVNGREISSDEFRKIDPEIIESIEPLDASDENISLYGNRASGGIMLITLKFDTPARFVRPDHKTFEEYVIDQVDWEESEPAARVSIRYTITTDGKIEDIEPLEVSDKRLLRRVVKAMENSPAWQPALKMGQRVAMRRVIRLQLPLGKELHPEPYIIIL